MIPTLKIKKIAVVLFSLLLILIGLYWLIIGIIVFFRLYRLFHSDTLVFTWIRRNFLPQIVSSLLFVLAISIFIRLFVIEIFSIPSSSMENTLIQGDQVLVSKLNYGPVFPGSPLEIPWINLFWYSGTKGSITGSDSRKYRRMSGYSRIKHLDVMVFRHPFPDKNENVYIKRCTALPGDTIQLVNGTVYINRKALNTPDQVRQKYRLKIINLQLFLRQADSLEIAYKASSGIPSSYAELLLTEDQRKQIEKLPGTDSLYRMTVSKDSVNWVYPKHRDFSWTIDHYGPVVIPKRGLKIKLNPHTFQIYHRTIKLLEKANIREVNGSYFYNNELIFTYTFRRNYYFVMGDKRWDSNDSRYWGFVPEENIIGKGILVIFSHDEGGFKWNRLFKPIG